MHTTSTSNHLLSIVFCVSRIAHRAPHHGDADCLLGQYRLRISPTLPLPLLLSRTRLVLLSYKRLFLFRCAHPPRGRPRADIQFRSACHTDRLAVYSFAFERRHRRSRRVGAREHSSYPTSYILYPQSRRRRRRVQYRQTHVAPDPHSFSARLIDSSKIGRGFAASASLFPRMA